MSHYSVISETTEETSVEKVTLNIGPISIMQLYIFLLKLMVAGAMATAPIALVIWFANYAASH